MATTAAHFLIGYFSASVGDSASSRRVTTKKIPATSVIWTPEMVMMWKMPASRMRSLASVERKSRLPVTIAAAIAPSSPPMIALTLSARRLRA